MIKRLRERLFGNGPERGDQELGKRDGEMFHAVWERKSMPDTGALSYAWETLQLPLFTAIGAGVSVRNPTTPNIWTRPDVTGQYAFTAGIPVQAGYLYSSPLFDVNGNLVAAPSTPSIIEPTNAAHFRAPL